MKKQGAHIDYNTIQNQWVILSTGNGKGLLIQERDITVGHRLAIGENILEMQMTLFSPRVLLLAVYHPILHVFTTQ